MQRLPSAIRQTQRFVCGGNMRAMCSAENSPRPPKPRGDSNYVKRRRAYEGDMHALRVSFAEEQNKLDALAEEQRAADRASLDGVAEARAARKREKSIARQVEHKAKLAAIAEAKKERTAYRRKDWERKQKELLDARTAVADLLARHAHEWITKDTLDTHVERAVDDFFIVGASAKREVEEMVE